MHEAKTPSGKNVWVSDWQEVESDDTYQWRAIF